MECQDPEIRLLQVRREELFLQTERFIKTLLYLFFLSLLEKDFEDLKDRQGYDYIELQLDFAMDLYPFFPPLVKVIRPRLQGSMMLRVTTMEILKLSYWNPARNMKEVLVDIKAFLQTWARLDCKSERNDRSRYPDGAYIDIEHHLLRLALGKS